MSEIFNNIISGVGITDVIDVVIVAFVIYKVLGFIRGNKSIAACKRAAHFGSDHRSI